MPGFLLIKNLLTFQVEVFCLVMPCSAVVGRQSFRGPLQDVTARKTSTWNITAVKASKLALNIYRIDTHCNFKKKVIQQVNNWAMWNLIKIQQINKCIIT